jgi:hypothetical protein
MPSVQYLVMMKEGITAVKAAQRTITIPTLIPEDRKRQYKRFDEAFERISKAIDEYQKNKKIILKTKTGKFFWKDIEIGNHFTKNLYQNRKR